MTNWALAWEPTEGEARRLSSWVRMPEDSKDKSAPAAGDLPQKPLSLQMHGRGSAGGTQGQGLPTGEGPEMSNRDLPWPWAAMRVSLAAAPGKRTAQGTRDKQVGEHPRLTLPAATFHPSRLRGSLQTQPSSGLDKRCRHPPRKRRVLQASQKA